MYYRIKPEDVEEIIDIISQNSSLKARFLAALQDRPVKWRVDESSGHRLFRTFCEEKGVSVRTYNAVARSLHVNSKCTVNDVVDDFNRSNIRYLDDYFSNIRNLGAKGVQELMGAFDEITISDDEPKLIPNMQKELISELRDMSADEATERFNELLKRRSARSH